VDDDCVCDDEAVDEDEPTTPCALVGVAEDEEAFAGVDVATRGVLVSIEAEEDDEESLNVLGVDVATTGVDVGVTGVDVGVTGVDVGVTGVDVGATGVDVAVIGADEETDTAEVRDVAVDDTDGDCGSADEEEADIGTPNALPHVAVVNTVI